MSGGVILALDGWPHACRHKACVLQVRIYGVFWLHCGAETWCRSSAAVYWAKRQWQCLLPAFRLARCLYQQPIVCSSRRASTSTTVGACLSFFILYFSVFL